MFSFNINIRIHSVFDAKRLTAVSQILASAFSVISKMLEISEKSENRKYSSPVILSQFYLTYSHFCYLKFS